MEWSARLNRISYFLFLSTLVGTPALAERTKPIEVTLPTSAKDKENAAKKSLKAATKSAVPEPVTPAPAMEQTSADSSARTPASEAGSNPEAIETAGSSATIEARPVLPPAAEAAIILSRNQFYPSRLLVPQGTRVRIWFTTVESKPAALVIEGLKMQRWIASEATPTQGSSSGYFELQRELTRERVTEITLQPSSGTYPFFDALSGARGEIIVE